MDKLMCIVLAAAGLAQGMAVLQFRKLRRLRARLALLEEANRLRERKDYSSPRLVAMDQRDYQPTDPRYETMERLRMRAAERDWRWLGLRCNTCGKAAMEEVERVEGERKIWLTLVRKAPGEPCVGPGCEGRLYATMKVCD